MAFSIEIYSVRNFFSLTKPYIFVIYLFKFGIKFLLISDANLTIFLSELCSTFEIELSKLLIFCKSWEWYDLTFFGIYLSELLIIPLLASIILQTCPMNDTFYFNFPIFLSIRLRVFSWSTNYATLDAL